MLPDYEEDDLFILKSCEAALLVLFGSISDSVGTVGTCHGRHS